GRETKRFSGCIADQNIGSLTLVTPLLRIRAKSVALSGLCGEIPAKEGGERLAAAGGATARSTRAARASGSLRFMGGPVVSEIIAAFGAWRSLVARTVRVGEVPGSNPGAPIKQSLHKFLW